MTEKDWHNCKHFVQMLNFLEWKVSARKLRLFIVASYRSHWKLFVDPLARRAVEVAECLADNLATEDERAAIHAECNNACHSSTGTAKYSLFRAATWAVARKVPEAEADLVAKIGPMGAVAVFALVHLHLAVNVRVRRRRITRSQDDFSESLNRSLQRQVRRFSVFSACLRELLGNPFRPVTVDPAWLAWHGGLIGSMAQCMYDARNFADMPILADALEEGGCTNADILNHCRQPGEHVRGCWVVDLLLGKS